MVNVSDPRQVRMVQDSNLGHSDPSSLSKGWFPICVLDP
eukprot:SAG22_NODE_21744_length_254_cov_0.980645_1_plen_38_part_10